MRIAADGTWFYQGTPIGRPALVKLFASALRRAPAPPPLLCSSPGPSGSSNLRSRRRHRFRRSWGGRGGRVRAGAPSEPDQRTSTNVRGPWVPTIRGLRPRTISMACKPYVKVARRCSGRSSRRSRLRPPEIGGAAADRRPRAWAFAAGRRVLSRMMDRGAIAGSDAVWPPTCHPRLQRRRRGRGRGLQRQDAAPQGRLYRRRRDGRYAADGSALRTACSLRWVPFPCIRFVHFGPADEAGRWGPHRPKPSFSTVRRHGICGWRPSGIWTMRGGDHDLNPTATSSPTPKRPRCRADPGRAPPRVLTCCYRRSGRVAGDSGPGSLSRRAVIDATRSPLADSPPPCAEEARPLTTMRIGRDARFRRAARLLRPTYTLASGYLSHARPSGSCGGLFLLSRSTPAEVDESVRDAARLRAGRAHFELHVRSVWAASCRRLLIAACRWKTALMYLGVTAGILPFTERCAKRPPRTTGRSPSGGTPMTRGSWGRRCSSLLPFAILLRRTCSCASATRSPSRNWENRSAGDHRALLLWCAGLIYTGVVARARRAFYTPPSYQDGVIRPGPFSTEPRPCANLAGSWRDARVRAPARCAWTATGRRPGDRRRRAGPATRLGRHVPR